MSRPKGEIEIALLELSVECVLAVWNARGSGEVCKAVEVVDPSIDRIELVQVGFGRTRPHETVGVIAPPKGVDHQLIEQESLCAGRPHHQAGIKNPEARIVVLIASELVAVAVDANPSNSKLYARED